jgi:uncharacterized protein
MIHKYKLLGLNIVLDVNSGAVYSFDDVAYDVLDYYKENSLDSTVEKLSSKYSREKIAEAYREIESLVKENKLFSEDIYKEYVDESTGRQNPIKSMCLHIAHDCNLRCKYCFASTGDFGASRSLMSAETGKKAIDFLIRNSGSRRNLEVDFFGGEPLMNFDVVKEIVEYARLVEKDAGKNFRFTITTNALLLNEENKEYINKNMDNIVLSIDGREEVNDKMRVKVNGGGSYKHILPQIIDMAESRGQDRYYVRGTFTRENLDFSNDVLHLADLGFKQISIEPVVAPEGTGYEIREEDLEKIYSEYEKLAVEYVKRKQMEKGFNFFHFMIDLDNGPCAIKRLKGCGAGEEYVAITPEGDIYPCHQLVNTENCKLGNVYNDDKIDQEISNVFSSSNIYTKNECMDCWAKFYCSGGCPANAYQFNKDINEPYKIACKMELKRVECALWIKIKELLNGEE